jgi:hypothetical protein
MKNKIKIYLIFLLTAVLVLSSCTSQFEEMNTNPVNISEKSLEQDYKNVGSFFIPVQEMIYMNYNWGSGTNWTFQVAQNLNADIWGGYMASATPFAGNSNNQTYNVIWNDFAWDYTYAYMMSNVSTIRMKCAASTTGEFDHFRAVLDILTIEGMHRMSDLYGPIIYTNYGNSGVTGSYDDQKTAYYAFFKDLKNAVTTLKAYMAANPGIKPFQSFDQSYAGDYGQWIKLANSLRLRLAMRIVKVDPTKAKTEAESAVSDGVMIDNSDNYTVGGYTNPLAALTGWTDIQLSANLESIMGGYNDPRLNLIATASTYPGMTGQMKGMRSGIPGLDDNSSKLYKQYSFATIKITDSPVLMNCSEVYFLRAEGALRGWSMGETAKQLYEMGIQKSFDKYGVNIGNYLTSTKVPKDYVDYVQPNVVSGSAPSTVTPIWDESAANEVKLEKIITQKWIANYPEGCEAWAEVRRTGYPKLFKVLKNDSNGDNLVTTEEGVRRLNFSQAEKTNNAAGVIDAITKLGGKDSHASRVWWDVKNTSNF